MAKKNNYKKYMNVLVILVLVITSAGALFLYQRSKKVPISQTYVSDREMKTITIKEHNLFVEIVTKPESLTQGLSGRSEIGADGMLFLLQRKGVASFWMKEMKFDLDIIWIADGVIVHISEQVPMPSPGTPLNELPLYSSQTPVNAVLEIPAGDAKRLAISVGDAVLLPRPLP